MNRVIMTSFGERASYILNDGTRVVLHAGSRLEIPENYNKEIRQLYLEGEAYFETVHNPDKPFIVHSKHAYTRVVGTRFLVQAWTESYHKVEVVVSEGKVLFGDRRAIGTSLESREVLIAENQRAVLSENEMPHVTEVEEIDWYLGWTEGRLVFEDRPLREVLPRLERWYNITFQVANEAILAQNITAEIDYSLPMSDVLNGIALTLGLEIERTENRLYVFR
jgi:transmembrane sensor